MSFISNNGNRRLAELSDAARFFTRLPLGAGTFEQGALARAAWAFPIVGAAVGIIAALAYAIADRLGFPPLAASLIAIGASVLATGGLHEDGLADTADGLGGGGDRAQKLAIMRDSRSGVFGVLALVIGVGLRMAAIAALSGEGAVLAALVAAHGVARGGLAAVLAYSQSARVDGLGASAGHPQTPELAASVAIGAGLALVLLGLGAGLAALALAALVMAGIAMLARFQIGGYTGDVLGAIEQGGEIAMLLAAAAWAW
jgi:adenosylcobinamide-GDP ribazoletransferase